MIGMAIGLNRHKIEEVSREAAGKGAYSVIVYKEGDYVIAEDFKGRKIAEGISNVDDAKVIQKGIDYVYNNFGGGKVFIASGEFIVEALDPQPNIELIGQGIDVTILRLPSTALNPIIKPSVAKNNVHIHDLTLDGNNVSNIDIVHNAGSYEWHISNVKFKNAGRHALWLGANSYKTIIENCIIDKCGIYGIQTSTTPAQEVIIKNLRIYNTGDSALHLCIKNSIVKNIIGVDCGGVVDVVTPDGCIIDTVIGIRSTGTVFIEEGAVAGQNCIIDNIYAYQCGANYYSVLITGTNHKVGKISVVEHQSSRYEAIMLNGKKITVDSLTVTKSQHAGVTLGNGSEEITINSVHIEFCVNGLIIWRSERHRICGGVIKNNSNYGLYINAWEACRKNIIEGLRIFDDQASPTQQYGIYVLGPYVGGTVIRNCKVWNNVTKDVYIDASVTEKIVFEGVEGYATKSSGTATFSGDGTTTDFLIGTHGLAVTDPSKIVVKVTPASPDAIAASPCVGYVSDEDGDGKYESIRVKFASAPAAGTDNVKVVWEAEVI